MSKKIIAVIKIFLASLSNEKRKLLLELGIYAAKVCFRK